MKSSFKERLAGGGRNICKTENDELQNYFSLNSTEIKGRNDRFKFLDDLGIGASCVQTVKGKAE